MADDEITFQGGVSLHRGGIRTFKSVRESVEFYLRCNGCNPKATNSYLNNGGIHIKSWGECRNDTGVTLYLIEKWGHGWHGQYFTADFAEDDPLKNFDAAQIIWGFFESHRTKP